MGTKVVYQINAALSTSLPLLGVGDESIIDIVSGEVIARFWNGNFVSHAPLTLTQAPAGLMEESTLVLPKAA